MSNKISKLVSFMCMAILTSTLFLSSIEANAQQSGLLEIEITYPNGDRADTWQTQLKIYQDSSKEPYKVVEPTSNPYVLTSLPLDHKYKVEVYVNGMFAGLSTVNLMTVEAELDVTIAFSAGLRLMVYYEDGSTPLEGAKVSIKSQDGTEWRQGMTDSGGKTPRYWIQSTVIQENYYIVSISIGKDLVYEQTYIRLDPLFSRDIKITTPWPSRADQVLVSVYKTESEKISEFDGKFYAELYDLNNNKVAGVLVNKKGDAFFSSIRGGDYILRVFKEREGLLHDREEWSSEHVSIASREVLIKTFRNEPSITNWQLSNMSNMSTTTNYSRTGLTLVSNPSTSAKNVTISHIFDRDRLAPYDILENVNLTVPAGSSEIVQLTVTPKDEGLYYAYIFATGDDNLVTDQMPWFYAFATKTSALPTELVESMTSLQNVPTSCDCVAFRMDDIQDFFTREAQIDLINLFLEENIPVTLGVIGGSLQIDKALIQFLQNSTSTGLLEIANHGWVHTPHFDMTIDEQSESIVRTNRHLKELFNVEVETFIAPENAFNNDTLSVMKEAGMTHFAGSAIFRIDKPPYPLKNGDSIFHFPGTAFDSDIEGGSTLSWKIFPNEQVIGMINSSMEQYGFATVVMHPFAYYEKQDSGYVYHKEMIEQLRPLLKEIKKEFKTVKMNEIDKQGWIPKDVLDNSSVRHALALKSDGVTIATGADIDIKIGKERLFVERKGSTWGQPFVLTIPGDVMPQAPMIMLNDAVMPSMKWFNPNTKTWIIYADPPSSAESLSVIPESGIRDAKVQLPASTDSYFSGKTATIPYSIVNTGTVSSEFHVKYSLGNDISTFVSNSAKIFLQKDENRSLQLNMTLPSFAGEYTLTVEVLAGEGSNNVLSSASQNIIISRTISTDTLQKVPTSCDCVAFRVDDVQDFFARQAQIDLISIFLEEDSPVTIGVVASALQHDTSLIKFLQNATSTGLVEVASKGWNHTIYSKKTTNEQRELMQKTNERMKALFGAEIKTFVPPEYVFNNDTLSAMRETGLTHIVGSTFSNADTPPYPLKNGDAILHFPTTVFVGNYNSTTGEWKRLPNGELLNMIRTSVKNNGFAVVSIPPVAHYNKNFTTYMSETTEHIRTLLKDVKKEFKVVKTNEIDKEGWIPENAVGEKDLYQHTLELGREKIIIGSSVDIDIEAREGKFFITREGDTWDKPLLLWIPKAHIPQEPVIFAKGAVLPSMKWYDLSSETWIVYVDPPKSIESIHVIPEFGPAVFLFATMFVFLLFMITIRRIRILN